MDLFNIFIGFFLIELITNLIIFNIIKCLFYPINKNSDHNDRVPLLNFKDTFKGLVERIVLTFALINNMPHILTFFGAMKLGTRIKTETNSDDYNDFFLIGNLTSVALAIFYAEVLFPSGSEFMLFTSNFVEEIRRIVLTLI